MNEPIVFVSRFALRPGGRAALEAALADGVAAIQSGKPATALYGAYLDEPETVVRFVHAFADGLALERHFEGSEERASSVAGLLVPAGFELYGEASPGPVGQLRREAAAAGVPLHTFPRGIGGFLRAPG